MTDQHRRAMCAWQLVVWAGIAGAGVLALAAWRWHLDSRAWAAFAFGGIAVCLGMVLLAFPREFDAIRQERLGVAMYQSGLPARWVGACSLLVGVWTVLQRLLS